MTKENAQTVAKMLAMELRKCKGTMAGSSAKYSAMASILVAAGIEVNQIRKNSEPVAVVI